MCAYVCVGLCEFPFLLPAFFLSVSIYMPRRILRPRKTYRRWCRRLILHHPEPNTVHRQESRESNTGIYPPNPPAGGEKVRHSTDRDVECVVHWISDVTFVFIQAPPVDTVHLSVAVKMAKFFILLGLVAAFAGWCEFT